MKNFMYIQNRTPFKKTVARSLSECMTSGNLDDSSIGGK